MAVVAADVKSIFRSGGKGGDSSSHIFLVFKKNDSLRFFSFPSLKLLSHCHANTEENIEQGKQFLRGENTEFGTM